MLQLLIYINILLISLFININPTVKISFCVPGLETRSDWLYFQKVKMKDLLPLRGLDHGTLG